MSYLARLQFDPQFVFRSPELCGECAVSSVPAVHDIVRHSVDDSTIVVIVPRSKEEIRDRPRGSRSTARYFQREPQELIRSVSI